MRRELKGRESAGRGPGQASWRGGSFSKAPI